MNFWWNDAGERGKFPGASLGTIRVHFLMNCWWNDDGERGKSFQIFVRTGASLGTMKCRERMDVRWMDGDVWITRRIAFGQTRYPCTMKTVPAGWPWRGVDVTVFVPDINQSSLPTSFYSVLGFISVFMALSTVFHSIHSPNNSVFSLCSSARTSALLVHSIIYLCMKVSPSPYIILCAWQGLKHHLTN